MFAYKSVKLVFVFTAFTNHKTAVYHRTFIDIIAFYVFWVFPPVLTVNSGGLALGRFQVFACTPTLFYYAVLCKESIAIFFYKIVR